MVSIARDGWPGTTDRRMIDMGSSSSDSKAPAPQGKKWECCTACQGRGKVLVDDVQAPQAGSVPLSAGTEDGVKRYVSRTVWKRVDELVL